MNRSTLAVAGLAVLGMACGSGPVGGTESGNPINPPPPPAQHESAPAAHVAYEIEDEFDDIGQPSDLPSGPSDDLPDDFELPDHGAPVPDPLPDDPLPNVEPPATDDTVPDPTAEMPPPASEQPPGEAGEQPPSPSDGVQGGAAPSDPGMPAPTAPSEGAGAGGDTSSPVCEPTSCAQLADAVAESLSGPEPAPPPFTSSECEAREQDAACTCQGSVADVTISASPEIECNVVGRLQACLYESWEFEGCEASDDRCEAVCADVHQRMLEDAARELDVFVRSTACTSSGCAFVLETELQCLLGPELVPIDCALVDEQWFEPTADP